MRARKIYQLGLGFAPTQNADVAFDSDSGIVADALLESGQAIEQCALAAIRVTDNGDGGLNTPSNCYLVDRNTNFGWLSHQPL